VVAVQRVVDVGAEAAVQMLCGLDDAPDAVRRPDLGHGDVPGGGQGARRPRAGPPGRLPQRGLHRAQVDVAVGALHRDRLEGGDGMPELFASGRVGGGHAQDLFAQAEGERAGAGGEQLP